MSERQHKAGKTNGIYAVVLPAFVLLGRAMPDEYVRRTIGPRLQSQRCNRVEDRFSDAIKVWFAENQQSNDPRFTCGWHGRHERGGQKQNRRLRLGKSITAYRRRPDQQRITSIFSK